MLGTLHTGGDECKIHCAICNPKRTIWREYGGSRIISARLHIGEQHETRLASEQPKKEEEKEIHTLIAAFRSTTKADEIQQCRVPFCIMM